MRAQMEALSFTNTFVNRIKEAFIIYKKKLLQEGF